MTAASTIAHGTGQPIPPESRPMFPAWVRAWHWINAVLFIVLAATGFSLHFAGAGLSPVAFRPAVVTHNTAGVLIALNWLAYAALLARTGEWRQYAPDWRTLARDVRLQAAYYLGGVFRGEAHPFHGVPERRFNPLQRLTYLGAMFGAFPLLAVTGTMLLFPGLAPERVAGLGGIWPVALLHTLLAYFFLAFLIAHLYLALGMSEPGSGLRAMLGLREALNADGHAAHDHPAEAPEQTGSQR